MTKILSLRVSDEQGIVTIQKDLEESYEELDSRAFHKENCFADTSIEQFHEIVVVGHAHDGKYENFDAKSFARKFKQDFIAAGHAGKEDQVKEIFAIGCELGCVVNETSYAQQLVNELYKQGFTNVAFKAVLSPPDMPEGSGMRMTFNKNTKDYSAYWIDPESNIRLHEISERRDAIREELSVLVKKYMTTDYHEHYKFDNKFRRLGQEDGELDEESKEILNESSKAHTFLLTDDVLDELGTNKDYHLTAFPILERQAVKEADFQQKLLAVIDNRINKLEEKLENKGLNAKTFINFVNKKALRDKVSVLKELRENIAQGKTAWEDIIQECVDKKEFKNAFSSKESTTKVVLHDLIQQAKEFSQDLMAEQESEKIRINKEMRNVRGFVLKQAKEYDRDSEQHQALNKLAYNVAQAHNAAPHDPVAWQAPIRLALESNDLLGELIKQNEKLTTYLERQDVLLNNVRQEAHHENPTASNQVDLAPSTEEVINATVQRTSLNRQPSDYLGNMAIVARGTRLSPAESSSPVQEVTSITTCRSGH